LVLTSLHATDAVSALHRFLDMGIESFLVASSVNAVAAQRLVRRICNSCKEAYEPSPEELAFFQEGGGNPDRTFFRGAGCNFCSGTGYCDRVGVYEVLDVSQGIKQLLVAQATHESLRETAVAEGMRTLRDEAIRLVTDDVTTISEVIRNIYVV